MYNNGYIFKEKTGEHIQITGNVIVSSGVDCDKCCNSSTYSDNDSGIIIVDEPHISHDTILSFDNRPVI